MKKHKKEQGQKNEKSIDGRELQRIIAQSLKAFALKINYTRYLIEIVSLHTQIQFAFKYFFLPLVYH